MINPWFSSRTTVGEGASTNVTIYSGVASVAQITGSTKSTGHWVTLTPSLSQTFVSSSLWTTSIRMDGQWASQPLISTEQFGIGGVNSVRGYHEGQVFGDTGWHISLQEQTPPHVVGIVYGDQPLTIQGIVYVDFGEAYLLDAQGRQSPAELRSTGFGFTAAVSSHWQTEFLFSVPLKSNGDVPAYEPYFNFALSAQF